MPKGKKSTPAAFSPPAMSIRSSPTTSKGFTESSISLAEISVRVVEYAEEQASPSQGNKILDPQKCYLKIAETIGIRRSSAAPTTSLNTSPNKAPSAEAAKSLMSRVSSPTSVTQVDAQQFPPSPTGNELIKANAKVPVASPETTKDRRSKENIVKRRVFDVLHILENTGVCRRVTPNRAAGYFWYGLKTLSKGLRVWQGATRQYGQQHEKTLRHLKVPILSTISYMFLRVCMNTPNKSTTLKDAAAKIFKELLLKLKDAEDSKLPTQKGVERRLYDVVSVLATVGVISRTRKSISVASEILRVGTCEEHARQAMMRTKQNPHKRRKPRTSEEVALDKFLKALRKSNSASKKLAKKYQSGNNTKHLKSGKDSTKRKNLKESKSKKRRVSDVTAAHRSQTLQSPPKKRKSVSKSLLKHKIPQELGNAVVGTNVLNVYSKAEEIGVQLEDISLFVTALGAL